MGLIDFSLKDVDSMITGFREAITGEKIKDPVEMAKIEMQLQSLENALLSGQLEINKVEAQHPNIFIAGWRPFVGWVGGIGLAYIAFIEPIMRFVAMLNDYTGTFPVIDTNITMQVLLAMLGIGGMRSFDKKNKTDTKKIK
jgi:hypothetical protein